MRNLALSFYKQGYGCSQCILKAAEVKYKISVSKQCFNGCNGINTGFGVGGMCSVIIAGIMVFGIMFAEEDIKRLRMKLFDEVNKKYKSFNCGVLIENRKRNGGGCDELIGYVAECIERVISQEKSR